MNDIGRDPAREEAEQARASFTADFAGTIKIYQVLNERWQDKTPLFLLRTVQYNRVGRMRVPKRKKKKKSSNQIPIAEVAEKLKLTAQPVRASDSMRISLNGIHNVKNIDEKGHKNFVPVKIKFIGNPTPHKRKPTEEQIFKTLETVLVLNPKKGAISEGIQVDLSDLEVASRVLFECEFPAAENSSPKKRQKTDQSETALSGLWTGHWVISSPIREGEHCLDLLPDVKQENIKPPNKKALSWQTFDGNLEGLPPFGNMDQISGPFIRFNLCWTEAISHLRSDVKRSFLPTACTNRTRVRYQLYYMSKSRVCTQTYDQPLCQFCEIKPDAHDACRYGKPSVRTRVFKSVKDLMCHLTNCHDKFLFKSPEQKAIDSGLELDIVHIEVYPNPKYARSYLGNSRNVLDSHQKNMTKTLVWKGAHVDPDEITKKEFDPLNTECSLQTFGHTRLYFHTSYNLPIRACEFEYDSEDDQSHEFNWVRSHMVKQIDEFTDVNEVRYFFSKPFLNDFRMRS
jgi:hypothetical protein